MCEKEREKKKIVSLKNTRWFYLLNVWIVRMVESNKSAVCCFACVLPVVLLLFFVVNFFLLLLCVVCAFCVSRLNDWDSVHCRSEQLLNIHRTVLAALRANSRRCVSRFNLFVYKFTQFLADRQTYAYIYKHLHASSYQLVHTHTRTQSTAWEFDVSK